MSRDYPNGVKTEKLGLSPYESAKQERRILRALKQGANLTAFLKMGVTEARVRKIAAANNIEIKKGVGGKRL